MPICVIRSVTTAKDVQPTSRLQKGRSQKELPVEDKLNCETPRQVPMIWSTAANKDKEQLVGIVMVD